MIRADRIFIFADEFLMLWLHLRIKSRAAQGMIHRHQRWRGHLAPFFCQTFHLHCILKKPQSFSTKTTAGKLFPPTSDFPEWYCSDQDPEFSSWWGRAEKVQPSTLPILPECVSDCLYFIYKLPFVLIMLLRHHSPGSLDWIRFQQIKTPGNSTYAGEANPGGVPVWVLAEGNRKLGVEPCEL